MSNNSYNGARSTRTPIGQGGPDRSRRDDDQDPRSLGRSGGGQRAIGGVPPSNLLSGDHSVSHHAHSGPSLYDSHNNLAPYHRAFPWHFSLTDLQFQCQDTRASHNGNKRVAESSPQPPPPAKQADNQSSSSKQALRTGSSRHHELEVASSEGSEDDMDVESSNESRAGHIGRRPASSSDEASDSDDSVFAPRLETGGGSGAKKGDSNADLPYASAPPAPVGWPKSSWELVATFLDVEARYALTWTVPLFRAAQAVYVTLDPASGDFLAAIMDPTNLRCPLQWTHPERKALFRLLSSFGTPWPLLQDLAAVWVTDEDSPRSAFARARTTAAELLTLLDLQRCNSDKRNRIPYRVSGAKGYRVLGLKGGSVAKPTAATIESNLKILRTSPEYIIMCTTIASRLCDAATWKQSDPGSHFRTKAKARAWDVQTRTTALDNSGLLLAVTGHSVPVHDIVSHCIGPDHLTDLRLYQLAIQPGVESVRNQEHSASIMTLQQLYWWPRLAQDVTDYVHSCSYCNTHKGYNQAAQVPIHQNANLPTHPFSVVHMDLTGASLPTTKRGNKYILVVKDSLTRYVEIYPLRNKEPITVAQLLVDHIYCRHGAISTLVSDQGTEFLNKVITQVCALLRINKVTTAPHAPRSNGLVENHNRTLKDQLAGYTSAFQDDWDLYLPLVAFTYNTTVNSTTGYSPYFLLHGREASQPHSQWISRTCQEIGPNNIDQYAFELAQRLSFLWDQLAISKVDEAKKFNRTPLKPRDFKEYEKGDLFFLKMVPDATYTHYLNPKEKRPISAKLQHRWVGPFEVEEKLTPVTYMARINGTLKKIHAISMKPLKSAYKYYYLSQKKEQELDTDSLNLIPEDIGVTPGDVSIAVNKESRSLARQLLDPHK